MHRSFLSNFERVDAVLLGGAIVGCALYLIVLPLVHPDRAAAGHAPKDSIVEAAREILTRQTGQALSEDPSNVTLRRAPDLLDSLHLAYGREETIRLIREHGVPAYYWDVDFFPSIDSEGEGPNVRVGSSFEEDNERRATVRLTLDGRPFHTTVNASFVSGGSLHDGALRTLVADSLRYALFDSVGADRWTFRFDDQPGRPRGRFQADIRDLNAPPSVRPFYLRPEARVLLNQADASALARFHVRGTFFDDQPARVDSVTTSGAGGRATATVHVSSVDSSLGRRFRAAIEVAPTGELLNLEPSFVQEQGGSWPRPSDVPETVQLVMFVVLSLVAFIVFLRRIRHQLVDVGVAFRDGALAAVATYVALVGAVLDEVALGFSLELLMILLGLALPALAAGVLIFFLSGAANSTARDAWGEKLQTMDLAREAYIRNVPVGRSMLRGTGVGLTIVAFLCAGLILAPPELIEHSGDPLFYASVVPGMPLLLAAVSQIFAVLFLTYAAVLGVAALLKKRTSSPFVLIGGVAVVLLLARYAPLELGLGPITYPFLASIGLLVGWTLWRFDVLTVFIGLFSAGLLWDLAPAWVVPGTPEFASTLLAFLFIGAMAGVGALGVSGGRTTEDLPLVVPEYIQQVARKERLERELELARSMQMSFLPRSTPRIEGLDIASVCLPAYEVGGDFYDFFPLDAHRLAFAVGDVSGKGMEAAFYMTLMKGMLQSLMLNGTAPANVLSRANELFRRNAARGTFMSMALCVLDVERRLLTFARAGQNPLLVRRSNGLETIKPLGLALGLADAALFDVSIEQVDVLLEPGDLFVVYTDGVTEAMNPRRELYGEDRLAAMLTDRRGSASEVMHHIVGDVRTFRRAAPSHDDMTLLVARLTDEAYSSSSS